MNYGHNIPATINKNQTVIYDMGYMIYKQVNVKIL